MSNTVPNSSTKPASEQKKTPAQRPNESGAFSVEGHVRIFDPKTREVYVEGRA